MPTPARVFHLYRERNWTAARIARQYPRAFRNQWDVYALLRRHGLGKKVLTPACAARVMRRELVQHQQVLDAKAPLIELGMVLLRCHVCHALSQQARCEHCLTLINPVVSTAVDRAIVQRNQKGVRHAP